MKQIEFINRIVELQKQNPNAEIRFCVERDEIMDDYTWTMHKISKVELEYYHQHDEYIRVGKDDIIEFIDYKTDETLSDSELEKLFEEQAKLAILVYTNAS